MNWKELLIDLQNREEWDNAVALMKNVINQQPEEDAYLLFNFMLMNVLVEEEYDDRQAKEYAALLLQYFKESRVLFNESPSWNYYSGMKANMSEWYMGLSREEQMALVQKAYQLQPEHLLYQLGHITAVYKGFGPHPYFLRLGKMILEDTATQDELRSKGALGGYINMLIETGLNIFGKLTTK